MDRSALLSAISRDEISLDWYKLPIICATAIVVIGLILEYWPEFEKFDFRQYNPDLVKTLVGGIIVTGAIAAEVLLTFFAQGAETALRNDNKGYISLLEKEASDADERSHDLELKTEELKSKNLALEKEIAPREVTDAEAKEIIDELKPFSGRNIAVKSYLGDVEGHRLLFILVPILRQAGLNVTPGHWNFDESPKASLLRGIEINAPPEQSDLADALEKVFLDTRLDPRSRWF
jgi:hypothetical protein